MNGSGNASPMRPLIFGAVIGLLIGLILGLTYAWSIDPATYAGGAHPHELSEGFKTSYVNAVTDSYKDNRDDNLAASRLATFSIEDKVALLARVEGEQRNRGLVANADAVGDLARVLQIREQWSATDISNGLQAGASDVFAQNLGQVAVAPPAAGQAPAVAAETGAPSGLSQLIRALLLGLLALLILALAVWLLLRLRPGGGGASSSARPVAPEIEQWDGSGPEPLGHWAGTYKLGDDTYDQSFTVETKGEAFLGECGIGILPDFSAGSPKRVMALEVWLFDKTDIRTVSVPVMSKFAFEDDVLRDKVSSENAPILAAQGQTFDIDTTSLIVKATIEDVEYGDEQPEMSYFSKIRIGLTAYVKDGADVTGDMPVPVGLG